MTFVQLLFLESVLLFSAGLIFFAGMWGTIAATAVLSGINLLAHGSAQFWRWEVPLLLGGVGGVLLLFFIGRKANKAQVATGVVGGIISLVFFGAFITPILAVIIWVLVVGMGLIPKAKKNEVLWSLAPTVLRLILGLGWIIYGNILTS